LTEHATPLAPAADRDEQEPIVARDPAPSRDPLRAIGSLPGPRGLPWLGNALQLDLGRLHLVLEDWARRYGSAYKLRLGPRRALVLSDTATVQRVLQDRPEDFRRVGPVEPVFKEMGAHGVFSAEGASWKRQRKLVMPAFSMRQLRELHPSVALFTQRLRSHWMRAASQAAVVDVRLDLMRYTVDVTSHIVFGRDLNTLEHPQAELQQHLSRIFSALNQRVNALFSHWRYFKLPSDRALDRSLHTVHTFLSQLVIESRADLDRDPARAASPKSLLEVMLVEQRGAVGEDRLSDAEISANLLTLLLAGEDTTSNTLAFALHHVGHDPEIQSRLATEADQVLGRETVAARFEDVPKLRYATAVTQETLRLRSAAPLIIEEACRDLVLQGISVPAGTWVFLLSRHVAVSEHNFSDPRRFDPERWLESSGTRTHNPRAMLAFGGGPRTCPGRALALFECAIVLSMTARNFVLEPVSTRDEVEEHFDFTMQPMGVRIRFRARAAGDTNG
jgi:cytochrome P450